MKIETRIREEVHRMRFEDIYGRYLVKELKCEEAAEILGISSRQFLRKRRRFESDDFDGRFDLRIDKPSSKRAEDAEVELVTRLYRDRYRGFNIHHFFEFARREHGLKRGYTWTKNTLYDSGLLQKGTRGGKHRLRRDRRPMAGMMIHQDASKHRWLTCLDYDLDLIVTMDDATSKITSAFFMEEEGTMSSFKGIRETIERYGLFCSLYTDRGSHYFTTPKAGGKVDKHNHTQVGRALKQLGIKHISAYSPQARGRSERMFGTLQGRLPQELQLMSIKTVEEANAYLRDVYLARHNEQFTVDPTDSKSAFIPWAGPGLKEILCVQEERIVQQDNTIRYNGLILQIPKNEYRNHYVKAEVSVHTYEGGCIAVFHGHMCLGRYDVVGNLHGEERVKMAA
jgi:hypothetical protein